jgi:hypothetical protein
MPGRGHQAGLSIDSWASGSGPQTSHAANTRNRHTGLRAVARFAKSCPSQKVIALTSPARSRVRPGDRDNVMRRAPRHALRRSPDHQHLTGPKWVRSKAGGLRPSPARCFSTPRRRSLPEVDLWTSRLKRVNLLNDGSA